LLISVFTTHVFQVAYCVIMAIRSSYKANALSGRDPPSSPSVMEKVRPSSVLYAT